MNSCQEVLNVVEKKTARQSKLVFIASHNIIEKDRPQRITHLQ